MGIDVFVGLFIAFLCLALGVPFLWSVTVGLGTICAIWLAMYLANAFKEFFSRGV